VMATPSSSPAHRGAHRVPGIDVTLYGAHRIKPEESQLDRRAATPWSRNARVLGRDRGDLRNEEVITELDGPSARIPLASTHSLGAVPVRFQFDGSDVHSDAVDINYSSSRRRSSSSRTRP